MARTTKARWFAGAAASVVTVGALVVGGGTAFADPGTAATAAATPAKTCTERIPALLARIDKLTARINGDATTKGSTAWLQAKETQARAAGDAALADLIDLRVTHRADRLSELARAKTAIEGVQTKDCAA